MDDVEEFDGDSSSWESMDEEEDSSQKFLQNCLILEKVFSHLPHDELLKCRLVNKLWNKVALLKNQLGSKSSIKITEDNFDEFINTAQHAPLPFCRQFNFHMLELDSRITSFRKIFQHGISSLSVRYCTVSSPKAVIKLLTCPNLNELKVTGALMNFENDAVFLKYPLCRLSHLELGSSIEYGHVSQNFMRVLIQNSPNLHSVCINRSAALWRGFVEVINQVGNDTKVQGMKIIGVEAPLKIEEFVDMFSKMVVQKVTFKDCIVGQEFLQEMLGLVLTTLQELNVEGTQHEILSRVFYENRLPRLTQLTLPMDGFSAQDGRVILESLPKLQTLKILGLFQTVFTFRQGQLISITAEEFDTVIAYTQETFRITLISEKQREFLKILSLLPLKPSRVEINLPDLNSRCLRSLFHYYPDLEELTVLNNSRQCLDAWTGIPIKICRKVAACKSFSVISPERLQRHFSLRFLKKLKRFRLTIRGDPPKPEFTLLYILYGICQLSSLEDLRLNNFMISDTGFLALSKSLNLKICQINGTSQPWAQYQLNTQNLKIKSFLLPPEIDKSKSQDTSPIRSADILQKIFGYLLHNEVFVVRRVSKFWYSTAREVLHGKCAHSISFAFELDSHLDKQRKSSESSQSNPNKIPRKVLSDPQTPWLVRALKLLERETSITKLILRGMNKSMLEFYQRENAFGRGHFFASNCEDRRKITYLFYPDGSDELIVSDFKENPKPTSVIVIGSWARKDIGLLEFLNPSFNLNSVVLFGLLQEVYDVVLPKLAAMQNIECLTILPFNWDSVSEINRNHLQILANSSFSLKNLSMQKLQVPAETIINFIKSHRFTLETLDIQNHVNVSDRLSFSIPHLKKLQLDEPPGALLWTTLNINQSLETIHFERSGYNYNQVKSKAIPKLELVDQDQDFDPSVTEVICDVNLFLECVASRRSGVQKSILQEGSDSALKFVSHFRFLTSLTFRSVHAHYGILQGIFRNLRHLEKLVFTNTAGITDEILTGFPRSVLGKMDLLNPLQFRTVEHQPHEVSYSSIRNMKHLTYLSLDDQTSCTDFSVIFGIMKLKRLKYFSCKKWKITDISIRAIADMTSIEHVITDGSVGVSQLGLEYLRSKRQAEKESVSDIDN